MRNFPELASSYHDEVLHRAEALLADDTWLTVVIDFILCDPRADCGVSRW